MATHSSIFAWKIPWTEKPGGLQSTVSQELDMTEHSTAPCPGTKYLFENVAICKEMTGQVSLSPNEQVPDKSIGELFHFSRLQGLCEETNHTAPDQSSPARRAKSKGVTYFYQFNF